MANVTIVADWSGYADVDGYVTLWSAANVATIYPIVASVFTATVPVNTSGAVVLNRVVFGGITVDGKIANPLPQVAFAIPSTVQTIDLLTAVAPPPLPTARPITPGGDGSGDPIIINSSQIDDATVLGLGLFTAVDAVGARALLGITGSTSGPEYLVNLAAFPVSGDVTKEYVAKDTAKIYRWTGSAYVELSAGTVNSTDAYLLARGNHTGTESADVLTDGTTKVAMLLTERTKLSGAEVVANKNVANGYAGLDSSTLIPASLLPSYVDDVLEYANQAGFPATGTTGKIFVALDTGKIYRWSGSAYVEISPSPGSTDSVTEGATNLYYTASRVNTAADARIAAAAATGTGNLVRASTPTITTPVLTGLPTGTGVASAPTASTLGARDASANLAANNHVNGAVSTATAAGTTTLTAASPQFQQFTGTTTQTVVLPDATTLRVGHVFVIADRSSGALTVNANGGGSIGTIVAGSQSVATLVANGSAAGTWDLASAGAGGGISAASVNLAGTYASRPAAGTAGRTYTCSDSGSVFRDNGTTWDLVSIGGFALPGAEPPTTGWTWYQQGSSVLTTVNGERNIDFPANASAATFRGETRTLPAAPYKVTACIEFAAPATNVWTSLGMFVKNSGSGLNLRLGWSINTGIIAGGPYLAVYDDAATAYASETAPFAPFPCFWFQIQDDNTTRFYRYSHNGTVWRTLFSHARTTYVTPDQIGWGCNPYSQPVSMRLKSWAVV